MTASQLFPKLASSRSTERLVVGGFMNILSKSAALGSSLVLLAGCAAITTEMSVSDGCNAFEDGMPKVSRVLDPLIDELIDGGSISYLAGDLRDNGEDYRLLAGQIGDAELRSSVMRWANALIGMSRGAAADDESIFVANLELELAVFEVQSLCADFWDE